MKKSVLFFLLGLVTFAGSSLGAIIPDKVGSSTLLPVLSESAVGKISGSAKSVGQVFTLPSADKRYVDSLTVFLGQKPGVTAGPVTINIAAWDSVNEVTIGSPIYTSSSYQAGTTFSAKTFNPNVVLPGNASTKYLLIITALVGTYTGDDSTATLFGSQQGAAYGLPSYGSNLFNRSWWSGTPTPSTEWNLAPNRVFAFEVTAIPEPSLLCGIGIGLIALVRRQQRS